MKSYCIGIENNFLIKLNLLHFTLKFYKFNVRMLIYTRKYYIYQFINNKV